MDKLWDKMVNVINRFVIAQFQLRNNFLGAIYRTFIKFTYISHNLINALLYDISHQTGTSLQSIQVNFKRDVPWSGGGALYAVYAVYAVQEFCISN